MEINQWQLFSTVGGLMGLFIGCSTMTLCEFPDFLMVFLNKKLRHRHVDKKVEHESFAEMHTPMDEVDSTCTTVINHLRAPVTLNPEYEKR